MKNIGHDCGNTIPRCQACLGYKISWAKNTWKKAYNVIDIEYELTDRILGLVCVWHLQ
jgi:hypothetical protein